MDIHFVWIVFEICSSIRRSSLVRIVRSIVFFRFEKKKIFPSGLAKHTIVNVDLLSQNVALMQLLHIRKIDIVQNKQCAICNVQPSITTCAHCSRQACVTCLETHRQEVIGEITRETMEIERMSDELKITLNQTSNDFRDQCDETFQQANKRLENIFRIQEKEDNEANF